MGPFPDITGIFYFAMFGLACAFFAAIGGAAWFIYFLLFHVQIV